jgi:hypothetical protein
LDTSLSGSTKEHYGGEDDAGDNAEDEADNGGGEDGEEDDAEDEADNAEDDAEDEMEEGEEEEPLEHDDLAEHDWPPMAPPSHVWDVMASQTMAELVTGENKFVANIAASCVDKGGQGGSVLPCKHTGSLGVVRRW